jgi:hypothetical protein
VHPVIPQLPESWLLKKASQVVKLVIGWISSVRVTDEYTNEWLTIVLVEDIDVRQPEVKVMVQLSISTF